MNETIINASKNISNTMIGSLPAENPALTYAQVYNEAWSSAVGRFERIILFLGIFLVMNLSANLVQRFDEENVWAERVEEVSWTVVFILGLFLVVMSFVNPVKVY